MKISKNSLGGKNNHGRMSGARSSRASSTICELPIDTKDLLASECTYVHSSF